MPRKGRRPRSTRSRLLTTKVCSANVSFVKLSGRVIGRTCSNDRARLMAERAVELHAAVLEWKCSQDEVYDGFAAMLCEGWPEPVGAASTPCPDAITTAVVVATAIR